MSYPGDPRPEAPLRQNIYFDVQMEELKHFQEAFQPQIDNFTESPGQTLYYFDDWPESIHVGGTEMANGMHRFFIGKSKRGEVHGWWLSLYHLEQLEHLEFKQFLGGTTIPVFREVKKK